MHPRAVSGHKFPQLGEATEMKEGKSGQDGKDTRLWPLNTRYRKLSRAKKRAGEETSQKGGKSSR